MCIDARVSHVRRTVGAVKGGLVFPQYPERGAKPKSNLGALRTCYLVTVLEGAQDLFQGESGRPAET